jgi:hypothetical protein
MDHVPVNEKNMHYALLPATIVQINTFYITTEQFDTLTRPPDNLTYWNYTCGDINTLYGHQPLPQSISLFGPRKIAPQLINMLWYCAVLSAAYTD